LPKNISQQTLFNHNLFFFFLFVRLEFVCFLSYIMNKQEEMKKRVLLKLYKTSKQDISVLIPISLQAPSLRPAPNNTLISLTLRAQGRIRFEDPNLRMLTFSPDPSKNLYRELFLLKKDNCKKIALFRIQNY